MNQRIVLAGGSGFLGSVLAKHFRATDWQVVVLTRSPKPRADGAKEVAWNARTVGDWAGELDGADVVINLTGRSVDCRYHEKNRRDIITSRVDSTRVLGEAIAKTARPPRVWLNASSATIYKHTLATPWDEHGEIGATPAAKDEFSIAVIRRWERAFAEAPTPRTRKVAMRTAMVLGNCRNSVAPVLRRLARLGLGGRMGSGRQFVSWIHEVDFCRAVQWLMEHEEISGAVNLCAPNPLPNAVMMKWVREVCVVPFGLPATEGMLEIGAFFLRTETELILKSRRVVPGRLLASGFQFQFPEMRGALQSLAAETISCLSSCVGVGAEAMSAGAKPLSQAPESA